MQVPYYARAPITEAVVEFRFDQPGESDVVERLKDKLAADYPFSQRVAKLGLNVNLSEAHASVNQEEIGYRLGNADQTEIALIGPTNVSLSRLAPYTGWG